MEGMGVSERELLKVQWNFVGYEMYLLSVKLTLAVLSKVPMLQHYGNKYSKHRLIENAQFYGYCLYVYIYSSPLWILSDVFFIHFFYLSKFICIFGEIYKKVHFNLFFFSLSLSLHLYVYKLSTTTETWTFQMKIFNFIRFISFYNFWIQRFFYSLWNCLPSAKLYWTAIYFIFRILFDFSMFVIDKEICVCIKFLWIITQRNWMHI